MAINGRVWTSFTILGITFIYLIPKKGGRTMAACKHCGGTGESFGKYCACVNGKFKKTQDRAKAKAAEELEKEAKQAPADNNGEKWIVQQFNQPKIKVGVGDWVEYQNALCIVDKVDEHDNSVFIVGIRWSKGGNVGLRKTPMWVDATNLKPMELANDGANGVIDHLETEWIKKQIDLALDKGDKKTFKKLVEMLPQPMPW
jgi:hypothetical protein